MEIAQIFVHLGKWHHKREKNQNDQLPIRNYNGRRWLIKVQSHVLNPKIDS